MNRQAFAAAILLSATWFLSGETLRYDLAGTRKA
jgi:hypothetical protein